MVPALARASRHLRARSATLLVVLCVVLLAWGVLRALHPGVGLRLVPAQVPAKDVPAPRPRPTLEPEPFS